MIEAPKPTALKADTPFLLDGERIGVTLGDFWSWGYSVLLNNKARGVLAEFIVAKALKLDSPGHEPWASFDFITSAGATLEVKSTAYLQAWNQKELSRPLWQGLRSRQTEMASDGSWSIAGEQTAKADVYVLCLFTATEHADANPMEMDQWDFWLVPGKDISSDTIGISAVEARYQRVSYSNLREALADLESRILVERSASQSVNVAGHKRLVDTAETNGVGARSKQRAQVAATTNDAPTKKGFRWGRAFLFIPLGLLPTVFWAWLAGPTTIPILAPVFLIGAFWLGGNGDPIDKKLDYVASDEVVAEEIRFPWLPFLFFIIISPLFFGPIGFVVMFIVMIGAFLVHRTVKRGHHTGKASE